jgi:hypothetical protein
MEWKNEMELAVLTDLAAICNKLATNSALPEYLRVQAREFVAQFDSLVPFLGGKDTAIEHVQGEELLTRMARFLPRVLEVEARPSIRSPSDG